MRFLDELGEDMPIWLPLSPPDTDSSDGCDLRMEEDCFDFMYEIEQMSEARLPHVIHEVRRPLAEKQKPNVLSNDLLLPKEKDVYDAVAKCLSMPPADTAVAASPAYTENSFSMDDTSQDAKIMEPGTSSAQADQIAQQGPLQGPLGPPVAGQLTQQPKAKKKRTDNRSSQKSQPQEVVRSTTPPPAWREASNYDGAEWNIIEDHALLQSVQTAFANMQKVEKQPEMEGMLLNWDLVAQDVNKQTRFYRSARQCSLRYQMFVRPKEQQQLLASDPITKRMMKVDLSTLELSHLRKGRSTTTMQYAYDYGTLTDKKHVNRFKTVERWSAQRSVQFWRGPRDLASRNLKSLTDGFPPQHVQKLKDFDIRVGAQMDAEEIVTMTDDGIAKFESNRRKLLASREKRPQPQPEPRFHTLVLRPYAVPLTDKIPPTPLRREMVIEVPPLVPAAPIVVPHPPSQSIQIQQNVNQQQHLQQQQQSQPLPSIHHLGGGAPSHHHQAPPHYQHHQQQPQHQNMHHQNQMGPLPSIGNLQHHHHQNAAPIQMRQQQIHQSEGASGASQREYHAHPQQQHHPNPATIQRRTVSGANMQYMQQQSQGASQGPQGQSYVVMGTSGGAYAAAQQGTSDERQQGAQGPAQGGPQQAGGPQGPQANQGGQGGPAQQPQRVQYVPQGAIRGPGAPGGGPGGYSNTLVMQRNGRVVRPAAAMGPGGPNRIYMDQRHHQYPQNVVPVRVMPAGQQPQRMIPGGQRRQPVAGTVAAMVMPHRQGAGGGVSQIRTMQRAPGYGPNGGNGGGGAQGGPNGPNGGGGPGGPQQQQQRINVMVQAQNMRAAGGPGGGPGGPGGVPAIRRQLVGHRQIQRGGHPEGAGPGGPQVAQVVVAPPQGMQAPPVLHMQRSYHQQSSAHSQQPTPPTSSHGPAPQQQERRGDAAPQPSSDGQGSQGPPSKL